MKWGIKPKTKTLQINFPGLSKEEILVLAIEAVKHLNWSIQWINDSGLLAYTRNSSSPSSGEQVRISADTNCVVITSTGKGFQLTDLGKNMANIEAFQNKFVLLTKILIPTSLRQTYELLKANSWKHDQELIGK